MIGRFLNGLAFLALAGLIVAVLRVFDWDPFAAIAWGIDWVWHAINRVADLFLGNGTFREATKRPE